MQDFPELAAEPDRKTIKVRIAVVMTESGAWAAIGGSNMDDDESRVTALDCVEEDGPYTVAYMTAEIPVPEPIEIKGKIVVRDDETDDSTGDCLFEAGARARQWAKGRVQ